MKTASLLFLMVIGFMWGADLTLTPSEKTEIEAKIVAIDAKIVKCDTKPEEIVQDVVKVYDTYIKAVNPSFAAWLGVLKQRMIDNPEVKAAEVKVSLIAEKAVLEKQIAEPNDITPIEDKPK